MWDGGLVMMASIARRCGWRGWLGWWELSSMSGAQSVIIVSGGAPRCGWFLLLLPDVLCLGILRHQLGTRDARWLS